eukprot:CAMPEP_0185285210 /NCGR_PEP_ID=MMETSP1363-20130426/1576_1 /TAXON_ID=38817 /ORGANISM="Gephyrocapsa oceanica, Strain RCC1303" /LENGTH=71 /DNA_ID=CAMNT_0027880975 /DNA_START=252 /DNA_END=464 /DNA_ORIENTATION=+
MQIDSSCLSGWWRGLIYLSGCSRCVKEPRVEGRHVEAGGDGRHHPEKARALSPIASEAQISVRDGALALVV